MAPAVSRILRPLLIVAVSAVLSAAIANRIAGEICQVGCIGLASGGLGPMFLLITPVIGIAAGVLRSPLPLVGWMVGTIYGVEGGSYIDGGDGVLHSTGGGGVAALHFIVFLPAALAIWGAIWLFGRLLRRNQTEDVGR